jgi:hypothetical protein
MSTRPRLKKAPLPDAANRAEKGYEEVAERIFRDDSPAEPLFAILDERSGEEAA